MANSEASSAHKGEELTGSKAYPLVHTFEGQSTISSTAKIAPSAILRGKVVIGDDVIIKDNVIIEGEVTIGSG